MSVILTVFHVIFCFTLILVILLQAGRGQGLTGPSFASGNVQSLFGTRAGDFLTKATSVAAVCFLLTCIGLDYIEAQKSRSLMEGPAKTPPIDIEKIKQALEKVKEEKSAETKSPAADQKAESQETAVDTQFPAPVAPAPSGSPASEIPAETLQESSDATTKTPPSP